VILEKNLDAFRAGARLLIALSLAITPLPAASNSHGQWDQERVTELAVELAVTMRGLRTEVRRSIPGNRATTNPNRRRRLLDNLRLLQSETRFLAAELEAGQGFSETLPVAQRINRLVDRAVVDGRRLFLPKPVQQRIDKANDLLEQLRPFYRDYANPEGLDD
jgi:hypothetical protein